MTKFFMFGKYSISALKSISPERTKKTARVIEKLGGEVVSIYALLGSHDIVAIVSLPGIEEAIKASAALTRLTGVSFSTSPAMEVDYFDKIMQEA